MVLKKRIEREIEVSEGLISFAGRSTQQRLERFLCRFHCAIDQYEANLESGFYIGYTGRKISEECFCDMTQVVLHWKNGLRVSMADMKKVLKF